MENLKFKDKRIISLKLGKKVFIILLFVLIFDFFLFPVPMLASEIGEEAKALVLAEEIYIENIQNNIDYIDDIVNNLPDNSDLEVKRSGYYTITAYNSEVGQTDATPCITANGFNLCVHGIEDSVAANFLKFGTRVRIPELFGDRIFVVRDRMNKRYQNRLDIWMQEKGEAKQFGIRIAKIEVLEGH